MLGVTTPTPLCRPGAHRPGMALDWSSLSDDLAPTSVIVVGFLLFVFPEPATSALGAGLLLLGVAWWFYEWDGP